MGNRVSLQKKVGYLLLGTGIYSLVVYIVYTVQFGLDLSSIIQKNSFALDFLLIIPGLLSILFENRYMKVLQSIFILFTGTFHIFVSYNEIYGPSLIFLCWLLLRQYGFFINRKRFKYVLLTGFFIVSIQLSAYIHEKTVFLLGNTLLQYSIFLILFILIVWEDIFSRDKELISENEYLKKNYDRIAGKLREIQNGKQAVDLQKAGITPAEERVLKELVLKRGSNREIAEALHISEATVKLHLYNIFNKLGADSRFTVIDMCKYNF